MRAVLQAIAKASEYNGMVDLDRVGLVGHSLGGYTVVELTRAGHLAWTNLRGDAHQRILDYALPFLDHYVRGQPAPTTLTISEAGISELRYQSELGRSQPVPARARR